MGTMQDYRSQQAWTHASSANAWTAVQASNAWPIAVPRNEMAMLHHQKAVLQQQGMPGPKKIQHSSSLPIATTMATPAFQWSNSWDPVVIVPQVAPITKKTSEVLSSSPGGSNSPISGPKDKKLHHAPIGPPIPNGNHAATMNPHHHATMLGFEVVPPNTFHLGGFGLPQHAVESQEQFSGEDNDDEGDEIYLEDGVFKKKKKQQQPPEDKAVIEEELSKQNLYKTELCRSFCETGVCRYGHKCQFAHGEHEIRPVMRHPKYKTEICKTFSNTGTCPYGNRCRFIHPGLSWGTNWTDDLAAAHGSMSAAAAAHHMLSQQQLIAAVEQLHLSSSPTPPHVGMAPMGPPMAVGTAAAVHYAAAMKVGPPNSLQGAPAHIVRTASGPAAVGTVAPPNSASGGAASDNLLKERESDIKALVDEDSDTDLKPRLAFFQNLTVL
eukprot:TRINITY_DN24912_c0_g1_i1.p1 TRINITY_DN24912_c0_g1~~TRINITY_DN24912_c0_g1_i1.p1  ORF type:complete len:438 (-),score=99.42 TRINITY_DN24912_c0_g1_i1:251-1564(-)